jgi:Leucine-rich repeat (LRR) protein
MVTEYEIQCPPQNPKISIRIQPIESITSVQIECHSYDTDYSIIPEMNINGIKTVSIRRCPLPLNASLASVLRGINVSKVQSLLFQSFGNELGDSLTEQHLQGMNDLQRLILSDNGLTDLPAGIFKNMTNLKFLNLRANRIQLKPNMFAGIESLEFLELSFNGLGRIEQGVFNNLKNLKHLNLWGNQLQNLTKDAFEGVTSIVELDLSANNMTTIDKDVFATLPNLSKINLSANLFTTLPSDLLASNKMLTQFRFINNRVDLPTLPDRLLADLPYLKEVQIRCNLQRVPDNLFKGSTNISSISFSMNLIERLPEALFSDQTQLIDLDMSYNQLMELPDNLFAVSTPLKVLRLAHNNLVNITG